MYNNWEQCAYVISIIIIIVPSIGNEYIDNDDNDYLFGKSVYKRGMH